MSVKSRASRGLAIGMTAVVAVAGTGCGGGGTKSESDVANVPTAAATNTDGRLEEPAKPLRLEDVRREQQGSPQGLLLRLFYFAQWGSAPNIASAYDPAVQQGVGVANIVGTYTQQRASLATSRLRIIESTTTPVGTFVSLEILRADAAPARHSYAMRKRFGGWRIVYDTFLEEGLVNYVSNVESRNAIGKAPDGAAAATGRLAAHTYRGLFADLNLDR